jgi:Mce-associated membrane protein
VNPSWYDLLGVEPGAGEAEIRSAWKAAIADLDPSDRRFRVLNRAAEVLLDPEQRAAYDAELAVDGPVDDDEAVALGFETGASAPSSTSGESPFSTSGASDSSTSGHSERGQRVVPGWALVVAGVVAALVVGACTLLAVTSPSDASIAASTRDAQSTAERAIVPILSYDGSKKGDLDADQLAAEAYMTADYKKEYAKLFQVIKDNAPETKTVVTAEVVASGIVRSGDDRVSVLVFVNRPTTNKLDSEPVVYKDQVTVTLQRVGNNWLVDDLVTSPTS